MRNGGWPLAGSRGRVPSGGEMLCAQSDCVLEAAARGWASSTSVGPPPAWKRTKGPLPSKPWLSPAQPDGAVEELAVVRLAGAERVGAAGVVDARCCRPGPGCGRRTG